MRPVLLVGLLGVCACGVPAAAPVELPETNAEVWVVVVHGSGDGPERWATPLVERLSPRTTIALKGQVQWLAWDWRDAAKDKLTAAERGQAEGVALARALRARAVRHVHVIAHSAGAHVAHGLELELSTWPTRPTLHLTLLDPFLGKGLDFEWGRARVGAHADFVEQWLNVGDGVPGTEASVAAAHVFDVSRAASKPALTGSQAHWWPIDAYQSLEPGFGLSLESAGRFEPSALRQAFPAGAREVVP